MTTQHYIFLENVRFYSYHGVAPQETAIGNEFIINLNCLQNCWNMYADES